MRAFRLTNKYVIVNIWNYNYVRSINFYCSCYTVLPSIHGYIYTKHTHTYAYAYIYIYINTNIYAKQFGRKGTPLFTRCYTMSVCVFSLFQCLIILFLSIFMQHSYYVYQRTCLPPLHVMFQSLISKTPIKLLHS